MDKRVIKMFGFGGVGFLPVRWFQSLGYRGKARLWKLGDKTLLRPQSLYFDIVHMIGTRSLWIFSVKTINIK